MALLIGRRWPSRGGALPGAGGPTDATPLLAVAFAPVLDVNEGYRYTVHATSGLRRADARNEAYWPTMTLPRRLMGFKRLIQATRHTIYHMNAEEARRLTTIISSQLPGLLLPKLTGLVLPRISRYWPAMVPEVAYWRNRTLNAACTKKKKKNVTGPLPLSEKTHPHSIRVLQVPTTQLVKMSIDPKFVELTADGVKIILQQPDFTSARASPRPGAEPGQPPP